MQQASIGLQNQPIFVNQFTREGVTFAKFVEIW